MRQPTNRPGDHMWLGPAAMFTGMALAHLWADPSLSFFWIYAAGAAACVLNWVLDNR